MDDWLFKNNYFPKILQSPTAGYRKRICRTITKCSSISWTKFLIALRSNILSRFVLVLVSLSGRQLYFLVWRLRVFAICTFFGCLAVQLFYLTITAIRIVIFLIVTRRRHHRGPSGRKGEKSTITKWRVISTNSGPSGVWFWIQSILSWR